MKLKLVHKLLVAMFACTALVLMLTMLIARTGIGRGFSDFLEQQENSRLQPLVRTLSGWYVEHGSWDAMSDNPRNFYDLAFASLASPEVTARTSESGTSSSGMPEGPRGQPPQGAGPGWQRQGRGGPGPGSGLGFGPGGRFSLAQRLSLLDAAESSVVGMRTQTEDEYRLLPIEVDGTAVGWLGVSTARGMPLPEEEDFIARLRDNLLIGLGIGLAAAILLGWVLARHLSRPVNRVAEGIRALAAGDFNHRLVGAGSDEIARLGDDLNRLASALGEHEAARKRAMSDIAHELRTPLAIINGELEAMRDGVRPLDKEQLESVRDEVKHLSVLVDDLHSLTMTDAGALAYKMGALDFNELAQLAADSFRAAAEQKGITLEYRGPGKAVALDGDAQRLRQLLHNLLDNAVRYTDRGGSISMTLGTDRQQARLVISDSEPGASEEECERMFERLYRLETSRNRNSGGSGLGLAICQNIVKAHDGRITARPGPLGGVEVITSLPLQT